MAPFLQSRRGIAALVLALVLVCAGGAALTLGVVHHAGGQRTTTPATAATGGRAGSLRFRPDSTTLASCNHDLACAAQAYGNVAYRQGPHVALAQLQQQVDRGDYGSSCHSITHVVGRAALARDADVGKAFAEGTAVCNSGYYHGVLIATLAGKTTAQARQVVATVCDDPSVSANGLMLTQCEHGLGHGTMLYSGRNLDRALALCDVVSQRGGPQICDGGAYMEYWSPSVGVANPAAVTATLSTTQIERVCATAAPSHRTACYNQIGAALVPSMHGHWETFAGVCSRAGAFARDCYWAMGGTVGTMATAATTATACAGAAAFAGDCAYGAVRSMLAYQPSGAGVQQLCAHATGPTLAGCAAGVGSYVQFAGQGAAAVRAQCARLVPTALATCLAGGQPPAPAGFHPPGTAR